jgi:hypothetical protein
MGQILFGGSGDAVEIDDRTLAHVKVVMLAKLRRNESFAFSFEVEPSHGGGRSTFWVNPAVPLRFKFRQTQRPPLNRAWLEALMIAANSVDGLRLVEEPPETTVGDTQLHADS